MVGVLARAIRGEINIWRASLAIALLVLVGAGVNPPLVAINVAILAIFIVVTIAFDPKPTAALARAVPRDRRGRRRHAGDQSLLDRSLRRLLPRRLAQRRLRAKRRRCTMRRPRSPTSCAVSATGRRSFRLPVARTSRGRPRTNRACLRALLWFVPIVALAGIALRRNQRPVTLFFLLVTIVSVPIVVGYYHDDLGNAITTPIYDQFYRNFPGFQMFRFSYKWVAGVEFGLSGLYALAVFAIVSALREHVAKLGTIERRSWGWVLPAVRTAAIALPILIFAPVVINKMNYPGQTLPSWEYRERSLVGADQGRRVALFPTQFLEQFDWGAPEFYIEDSLIGRPIIYGLLGSEPSEGTDMWVRRAYRATREGLPFAADMFRVMGVDTILQRDDFIPAIDFSSPGEWRYNSTTLTHDLLHRVVGASPVRSDGPLRLYHLGGALPLFYGVTHPVMVRFRRSRTVISATSMRWRKVRRSSARPPGLPTSSRRRCNRSRRFFPHRPIRCATRGQSSVAAWDSRPSAIGRCCVDYDVRCQRRHLFGFCTRTIAALRPAAAAVDHHRRQISAARVVGGRLGAVRQRRLAPGSIPSPTGFSIRI